MVALFMKGLGLHQNGRLEEARTIYEDVLLKDPKHFDALHLSGVIAMQRQNPELAFELIGNALKINPNNAAAHSNYGNALKELTRFDDALNSYEKAIKLDPDFADAHYNRGTLLQRVNRIEEALISYDKTIAIRPNYANAHSNRGNVLKELQRLDEALASYLTVITSAPDHSESYYNAAVVLQELRRFEEAATYYERAIALNPGQSAAYFNLGAVLHELKRFKEAVTNYDHAIACAQENAAAYSNRGISLQKLLRTNEALESYDLAIALQPDYADAHYNRGVTLQQIRRLDEALTSYDKAIAIKPQYANSYYNRGVVLQQMKQLEEALANYDIAITIDPKYADSYYNRGVVLQELNRIEEALNSYDKAIAAKPDHAAGYYNRGVMLQKLKRFEEALADYDHAIAMTPSHAEAYYNRGLTLQELRRLESAVVSYDNAIMIKPDYAEAYWNKSLALLLAGKFELGWALYEWRWTIDEIAKNKRSFKQPLWLGNEDIVGKKILLYTEQGLGDTIQFCRYAKLVKQKGATVILEVPQSLFGLLVGLDGVDELLEKGDDLPQFDYHCPLLSLPLAFRTRLDSIPSETPYIAGSARKLATWADIIGIKTRPRVGIVWSGSAIHKNDENRSLELRQILPYLPDCFEYFSLQKEIRDVDKEALASSSIHQYGEKLNDFADTAALCELMDLVISVDTSVAHLAGAIGKTTWILLPYARDWRWLLSFDHTPWYDAVELYGQEEDRQWAPVLNKVMRDLQKRGSTSLNNF